MYGYHTLWRRKKMRCAIAGCLGISALVSLLMVIGSSNSAHSLLQERNVQDYHVNFKDVPVRPVDVGLKLVLPGSQNVLAKNGGDGYLRLQKLAFREQKSLQDPSDAKGNDAYDNHGNGADEDGGYYGNDEPDNGPRDNGIHEVIKIQRPTSKQEEGFVMEDNAADYNRDYNDEEDEEYRAEEGEDKANPPFKQGDFDYSMLNKTITPNVDGKSYDNWRNRTDKIKGRTPSRNNSLIYSATQYKSMHLLENNQKHGIASHHRLQNNSRVGNRMKTSNVQKTVKSKQQMNVKLVSVNNERTQKAPGRVKGDPHGPCLSGLNCQILGQDNDKKQVVSEKDGMKVKKHNITSPTSQVKLRRTVNALSSQDESLRSHKLLTSNKYQNRAKLETGVKDLNVNDRGFDAPMKRDGRPGPVSQSNPFFGQNVIVKQRIETQIPIQDGGVDANWLLQEQPATQIQMPELPWQPGEVRSPEGIPLIVDKIFWSKEVEDLIPQGISNEDFQHFLHKLSTTPVKEMYPPQWNRCGRPRNQYIVLADRTPLCARYREEHAKLLHGEVLSFHFSRVLGLDNVPIVVLSEANSGATQWQGMNVTAAGWNESSIVALIQWVDGLDSEKSRVKMPSAILEAFESGGVFDGHHRDIHHLQANNLTELVQWSDMILFDYLTGHYDRVASMQDGADRENKPSIMHESIRNLRKVWQTSKMWLIDNESGLLDGYELLYHGGEMGRKFVQFHVEMLRTNCIFRRGTVRKILQLSRLSSPHDVLVRYAGAQDALYERLPYAKEMQLFQKYFPVRLKEVATWIRQCQMR